jgi:hypothetical protein
MLLAWQDFVVRLLGEKLSQALTASQVWPLRKTSASPLVLPLTQVPAVAVSGTETVRDDGLTVSKLPEELQVTVCVWPEPGEVQAEVYW